MSEGMRPIRIEIFRADSNDFTVIAGGEITQRLCWEEMLAQVIWLTLPDGVKPGEPRFRPMRLITELPGDQLRATVRDEVRDGQ